MNGALRNMMIDIKGVSDEEANILEKATKFFADQLMDPRMVRNLDIEIEVSKRLGVQGECVDEDGTKNPRWFTINLRRQKIKEMIKTLAHEMVHVKQHAKNELESGQLIATKGKGITLSSKWKGELWYPKRKQDMYYDSPWEIEAYGMEVGLFAKWQATQ
jgi:hypothetical protein